MFEKVKTRLAQAILMIIGTIWLVSDVYDNIISNFLYYCHSDNNWIRTAKDPNW